MKQTREFLERIGLPSGDAYGLPTSDKRFADGSQYRFEVPGIQGPGTMKTLLEELDGSGIGIHRVTQTKGIMSLTDEEIEAMVRLSKEWGVELVLSIGPRATTDTSASVNTPEGQRMGYRLRGQEQIVRKFRGKVFQLIHSLPAKMIFHLCRCKVLILLPLITVLRARSLAVAHLAVLLNCKIGRNGIIDFRCKQVRELVVLKLIKRRQVL